MTEGKLGDAVLTIRTRTSYLGKARGCRRRRPWSSFRGMDAEWGFPRPGQKFYRIPGKSPPNRKTTSVSNLGEKQTDKQNAFSKPVSTFQNKVTVGCPDTNGHISPDIGRSDGAEINQRKAPGSQHGRRTILSTFLCWFSQQSDHSQSDLRPASRLFTLCDVYTLGRGTLFTLTSGRHSVGALQKGCYIERK